MQYIILKIFLTAVYKVFLFNDVPLQSENTVEEYPVLKIRAAEGASEISHFKAALIQRCYPKQCGEQRPGIMNTVKQNRITFINCIAVFNFKKGLFYFVQYKNVVICIR